VFSTGLGVPIHPDAASEPLEVCQVSPHCSLRYSPMLGEHPDTDLVRPRELPVQFSSSGFDFAP
jgi:hypothetical protein